VTNPAHLSGPRHLDSFIVTPNACPSIGTLQKHMPTLTRTAPNQTAGPLGLRFRCNTMIANAQARVWQLAIATASAAAKHMLFTQKFSKTSRFII